MKYKINKKNKFDVSEYLKMKFDFYKSKKF
jgi:hypothetical protein